MFLLVFFSKKDLGGLDIGPEPFIFYVDVISNKFL